ncbi:hypothetical protein OC845_000647 [Tilletia horrida]|nr:hypothetical protein OC845_000647 [Tilletia horrida]
MSLPQRSIGNSDVKVAAIGYGTMGLASAYGPPKSQDIVDACLHEVIKQGIQMIDTADCYSVEKLGDCETRIGKFLKANPEAREKLFIATKFGLLLGPPYFRGDRQYVFEACQASLERLGISQIDLFYHHRPSPTDVTETAQALKELKDAGKIRFVGVSEYNLEQLIKVNEIVHIDAIQLEASPFSPEVFKSGFIDFCRKNGTTLCLYSPLGKGALNASPDWAKDLTDGDFRKYQDRFNEDNLKANRALVDEIAKIANAKGKTPSQIAIAWLTAQGPNIITIPGSTKPERIVENTEGIKFELTPEELKELNSIIGSFKTAGDRWSGAASAYATAGI